MAQTREDWERVKTQIEQQLKQQEIGVRINNAILKFVNAELAKLPAAPAVKPKEVIGA